MRFLYTAYLFLGVLLVFSSCSYKPSQVLFAEKAKTVTPAKSTKPAKTAKNSKNKKNAQTVGEPAVLPIPDLVINTDTATAKIVNYRIQPQDILEIRNLQNSKAIVDMNPPLSTGSVNSNAVATTPQPETFQVEDDGTIAMTAIGRIKVGGLTRLEAMKFIEDRLKATEVKNPIIDIKITNLKVTVLGEVKTPGNFPLTKDRTSIVEIIGAAGGLTEKANEQDIRIIRNKPGREPEVIKINFSKLSAVDDPKAIVQNNDRIVVSQNDRTVREDNVKVFSTVIQPVLIVLSALIVITSLIKR